MGKHHFKIQHENKTHKCYFEDDGAVTVLDKDGNVKVATTAKGSIKLDDAKIVAKALVSALTSA